MLKTGWKRTAVIVATATAIGLSTFSHVNRQPLVGPSKAPSIFFRSVLPPDSTPTIKNSPPDTYSMGPKTKTLPSASKPVVNLDTIPVRADVVKNETPVKAEGSAKKEDSAAVKARRDSILDKMFDNADKRVA